MEEIQVESLIQSIRLWKRYNPLSFCLQINVKTFQLTIETKCKI